MNIMNTPKTEIEAGKDLPLYVHELYVHELDGQRFGISHQDEAGHTHLIAIVPPYLGNGEKAIAICKAVNCHDELVEAMEKIQKILGEALPVDYKRDCFAALKVADVALSNLAKAKGEA